MNLTNPNTDYLLKKWAHVLDQTKHIRTFTTDRELAWIADYASWCSNYLEIGSWRGRSAKVALMANPALRITCLDTWDDEGTFEEFQHNLGPEISGGRVTFRRGPSQTIWDEHAKIPAGVFEMDHKQYNGCFIDGGHEEHLVKADILGVLPLMKKNSVMAGHDYRSENGGPNDVARGVLSVCPNAINPVESIWAVQL